MIVSPCYDITAPLNWKKHTVQICLILAYSQARWVLLLKISRDKSFNWLLLKFLLGKNWYNCVKYIRFSILIKDTFIKRLETAFIPKSLFHLRTNFPLQEPIFLDVFRRSSYQTNEDEKMVADSAMDK